MFEKLRERAYSCPWVDPDQETKLETETLMRHGRRWGVGVSVNH
jgi:hypothetical protein